jgi:hypothetical protein
MLLGITPTRLCTWIADKIVVLITINIDCEVRWYCQG